MQGWAVVLCKEAVLLLDWTAFLPSEAIVHGINFLKGDLE